MPLENADYPINHTSVSCSSGFISVKSLFSARNISRKTRHREAGIARRTPVRTLGLRTIVYHDWGRTNFTFNFVSETPLPRDGNDFGYSWGVFRKPSYIAMKSDKAMAGMTMPKEKAPPAISFQRWLLLGLATLWAVSLILFWIEGERSALSQ